jgi:acyl carrier protein
MNEQQKIEFLQTAFKEMFKKDLVLNADDVLYDLGIDSLDSIELVMYYEEQTGKQLPDTSAAIVTVKDMLDLM